ncbi:ABC transporter permease [Rhodococcus qingshengii]|uniref:ABC transporter permease n=1 Tax=Rhodococcus qingshengii TaxID=334542 RepID=UPI0036D8C1B4
MKDRTVETPASPAIGVPTLYLWQLRYDLLAQLRNPAAVFFSVALPLIFLVTFSVIGSQGEDTMTYYAPATMGIAVVSGTLTNIAITFAYLREYGLLKRWRLLPAPRGALLASRISASALLSLLGVAVIAVYAVIVGGTTPVQPLAVLIAVLLLTMTGSAIGLALTAIIPSENAAGPVANALALPLLMLSGGFFPLESAPEWVQTTASFLPFGEGVALAIAGYSGTAGAGDYWTAAVSCALWTGISIGVAAWRFSWTPRHRR